MNKINKFEQKLDNQSYLRGFASAAKSAYFKYKWEVFDPKILVLDIVKNSDFEGSWEMGYVDGLMSAFN